MERHSLINHNDEMNIHANVFSDDHEVEDDDYDMVADGFRPMMGGEPQTIHNYPSAAMTPTRASQSSSRRTNTRTSISSPLASPQISRHSTGRSRSERIDPFASPEDEDDATLSPTERPESLLQFEPDTHHPHRSVSSASSYVYAQTHSPRIGMAGPSHPYGMYPQGTVARTPSVATTSTAVPSRRSLSQRAPQHPYAMYPQGVEEDDLDDDEEDEDEESQGIRQNPVQVGFPGLGANYVRRRDPDNEDQDIIGDYGHAEQLPPYSRYPEDGPEKMPLLLPTALHSRAPVAGTDPGMPLMHTAFQPSTHRQSMMDDSNLARHESMSELTLHASESQNTSTSSAKKSWKEKSWKQRAQTRVWRIPCWWIMIFVALIVLVLAFLGGMIGGFVAGRKHAESGFPNYTVITSLPDASFIATPTGSAPPTGTFALAFGSATVCQSSCLTQPSQQVAWSCNMVPNNDIAIVVTPPTGNNNSGARIFYAAGDERIFYGAQAWAMNTNVGQFLTVQDNGDKDNGPAYFWQQYYDKIVVVPENSFNPATGKIKRQFLEQAPAGMPVPGQKPWFCVWNSTFLEGFIYVQRPKNNTSSASITSAASTTRPSSTATSVAGDNIITTVWSNAYTTATYIGPSVSVPGWISAISLQNHRVVVNHEPTPTPTSTSSTTLPSPPPPPPAPIQPPPHIRRQDADAGFEGGIFSTLPEYPYMVKLEERRLANNPVQPYCQQYQILWNMGANWVADPNGHPIIVPLVEEDPTWAAYQSAGLAGSMGKKNGGGVDGDGVGGCYCQWMSGVQG